MWFYKAQNKKLGKIFYILYNALHICIILLYLLYLYYNIVHIWIMFFYPTRRKGRKSEAGKRLYLRAEILPWVRAEILAWATWELTAFCPQMCMWPCWPCVWIKSQLLAKLSLNGKVQTVRNKLSQNGDINPYIEQWYGSKTRFLFGANSPQPCVDTATVESPSRQPWQEKGHTKAFILCFVCMVSPSRQFLYLRLMKIGICNGGICFLFPQIQTALETL